MGKKYWQFIIFSAALFVFGICLFFVRRSWLIIHWVPAYKRSKDVSGVLHKKISPKKKINFYYWKDAQVKREEVSLVWLAGKAEKLRLLIGNWLTFAYEERILEKRISIDSVALSNSEQEAYLSFDQLPFVKEWSINKKWQLLDALIRTVHNSGLEITKLFFLVRHEPMVDDHLDFSHAWPVAGYVSKQ